MIFEETEDGLVIHIKHYEMIGMNVMDFMEAILRGRHLYRSHANADLDDDHPDRK